MSSYKDVLKEALCEIKQEELEKLPSEDEIDYTFSSGFVKKVNKIIKDQKTTISSRTLRKAIIILVAAIIAMMIAGSAVADSNKILEFFYRLRDDVLSISYTQEERTENFKECKYTLNYVPEEYERTKSNRLTDSFRAFTARDNAGNEKTILLNQQNSFGTTKIGTQGNYVEEININSVDVIYVERDDTISCFWKEKGYSFHLSYPKELGKDFIMKNAGKLVELSE